LRTSLRKFESTLTISSSLCKSIPSKDILEEIEMDPDEPLLGLYWGVPLTERSVTSPPDFPDTIFLFQSPLEQMCETIEELEEEIEITVVHEIAHAVGIGEERLTELGYE
jgi:predicted Zn-dependent protease with MMP-like domain